VVIVNGNDAESGITISSVFSDDLMMAESDKEYNPIEFPDNTLKGYNVWFGAKPNTKRNDVHIVRPDIGLTAFRLTVVEGLKDDAITVNVSDAARMHSPDPNDPRLYTVNPFDDLSQTITTNMV